MSSPNGPTAVAVAPVAVTIWSNDGEPVPVSREVGSTTGQTLTSSRVKEKLRDARRDGRPIWLEIGVPHLDLVTTRWLDGSLDPWRATYRPDAETFNPPKIDWGAARSLLSCCGLDLDASEDTQLRPGEVDLLERLPLLYAFGAVQVNRCIGRAAARKREDSEGAYESGRSPVQFFPTVALVPDPEPSAPGGSDRTASLGERTQYSVLRVSVGVFSALNLVITVRLPDLRYSGKYGEGPLYATGIRDSKLPRRYLSLEPHPTAEDVAESIAAHHAATARAVAELVRPKLWHIQRAYVDRVLGSSTGRALRDPGSPASESDENVMDGSRAELLTVELRETADHLHRQVCRLLRRFGGHGQDDPLVSESKRRFEHAADELRALVEDCRETEETVDHTLIGEERASRARFHRGAAVIGAVIVLPALVAGVYGANVEFPGKDTFPGFVALVLSLVAFAGAALVMLSWSAAEGWDPGEGRWREVIDARRPAIVAAAATTLLVAAALSLSAG